MTRFIAVVSGKGGVGKTTVAINLGVSLSNLGRDVVVLDGNLTTPHIGVYLGYPNPPINFHEVIKGKKSIEEATYLHSSGLKVIPGSIRYDILDDISLNKVKKVFKGLEGYSETLLIDTGAGLTSENQAIIEMVDEVLIVTTPEFASVTDALKTIKIAEKQNKTVLGVVLNKIHSMKNEVSVDNINTILGLPIIGMIPRSDIVKQAQIEKYPAVYSNPRSEIAIEFNKIAERLK